MIDRVENPGPVEELRAVMERLRRSQEVASYAVNMARFNAETDPTNQVFIDSFMESLPVSIEPRTGLPGEKLTMDDPLDIRPTGSFAVITRYGTGTPLAASFVIGERQLGDSSEGLRQVLIASKSIPVRSQNPNGLPRVDVTPIIVLSGLWQKMRDAQLSTLGDPLSQEALMQTYNPETKQFVLSPKWFEGRPGNLHRTRIDEDQRRTLYHRDGLDDPKIRAQVHKRLYRARFTRIDGDEAPMRGSLIRKSLPNTVAFIDETSRPLMSSDFEEFEVMTHLEYLAAAYGAGEAFDQIKATREAKMPDHPAEKIYDQPSDYRQTVERPALATPIDETNPALQTGQQN